jgi:hypothetical protein
MSLFPRQLTLHEKKLVSWLLEQNNDAFEKYQNQIKELIVKSKCPCGCASIDFSYRNTDPLHQTNSNFKIISDYKWKDEKYNLYGIFLFSKNDILAGLEVWSIDGNSTPTKLPNHSSLIPIDQDF